MCAMTTSEKPSCEAPDCRKHRTYRNTAQPYCEMHKARFRRHGHFGLRDKSFHKLEKLPHTVDAFIQQHAHQMIDEQIAQELRKQGFANVTAWNVKYRRRKLRIRKYASGEEKKHKAWIRRQALRKHGKRCELCGYHLFIETHHIVRKHQGGPNEVDNLMVVCSNCHILLTRGYVKLFSRAGISRLREHLRPLLRSPYPYLC